jgi:hypothetical protein
MQEATTQRMRERRTMLGGGLIYRYDASEQGTAYWLDVSRVGAKLRLGRYLRPGRQLELEFVSPLREEQRVQLGARVIWCQQVKDAPDFLAGVYVRRESPEAAVAFAALGYQMLDDCRNANIPVRSGVSSGAWPHFHALGSAGWEAAAVIHQAV